MSKSDYKLGLFDVVILVISLVIGMGIFRTPAEVAKRSGDETLFYLAWIAGGVFAICGALTFAEVGRRMPVTGAYYRVFAQAYHPVIAFAVNVIILASNAASAAGVAMIGADSLAVWIPQVDKLVSATMMIMVLFALNLLGLQISTIAQYVFIGIKVLLLLCIISAIVTVEPVSSQLASVTSDHKSVWEAFGMALIPVLFAYGGYQSTINFGGEIRNSERMMPIGIMIGIGVVTAIYLLASTAYVHAIGFDKLAQSKQIASLVVERIFGETGLHIVTTGLVISVFAYINVAMLSNPRVIDAMSADGVFPGRLRTRSTSSNVQVGSLVFFTLASVVCVFVGKSFEKILNYVIFIDAIGLAFGAAAMYRLPGNTITLRNHIAAAVFIGSCLFVSTNLVLFDTSAALTGSIFFAGIILIGLLINYAKRR